MRDSTQQTSNSATIQGLSCGQIGGQLGVDQQVISRLLRRRGVPLRGAQSVLSATMLREALAGGLNATDMADRFGCSLNAVYRALRRNHLETAQQQRRRHAQEYINQLGIH